MDLANLLDEPHAHPPFRVVVSTSPGSVSNLDDLLNLRSIDIALVQSDVLELYRNNPDDYRQLRQKVRFYRAHVRRRRAYSDA